MFLSPNINKYFSNLSWLFFEKMIRMSMSIVVTVYVARYLGPDRLGLLMYTVSFVALFRVLSKLGLDEIVVMEVVEDENNRDTVLGTSFVLKFLGTLVMWLLVGTVASFLNNDTLTNYLIAIVAGGAIFNSFNIIDLYFRAKVISKYSVIAKTTAGVIIPLVQMFLIFIKAELIAFALVILLERFLTGIFFILVYKYKKLSLFKWKFDIKLAKKLLAHSWPLIFAGFMITLYMKIDQIMLKNMMDETQVGIYGVAVKISEFWYFIPVLLTQSIFPAIIRSRQLSESQFKNRMQHLYNLMTFISVIIAIIITFTSDFIMGALFGKAYLGSEKVLMIHIWAGIFVFYGTARGRWIIAKNLQKKAIIIHISGAIFNIILNLLFIPMYGVIGAALATTISYSLNTIITGIAIKEFRPQFKLFLNSFINLLTFRTIRSLYLRKII